MKLQRLPGLVAVGVFAVALSACACGAKQQATKAPVPADAVGTTQLMAAEMHLTPDQLKVGKSQHSQHVTDEAVLEDEPTVKDPPRRDDRRRGSGFSGWK